MTARACSLAAVLLALLVAAGCAARPAADASAPEVRTLGDFERGLDGFVPSDGVAPGLSIRAEAVVSGRQALSLIVDHGEYPGITREFPAPGDDWSRFDGLRLRVTNLGADALTLGVRVDDAASAGYASRFDADPGLVIAPGANDLWVSCAQLQRGWFSQAGIDLRHIVGLRLFLLGAAGPRELLVDGIELVRHPRPRERLRGLLTTGPGRTWEAGGGAAVSERGGSVAVTAAGGEFPGVRLLGLGD